MMRSVILIFFAALILAGLALIKNENIMSANSNAAEVNVWDTYVTKKEGGLMHFDIVAPVAIADPETIYAYGKQYLKGKGQEGQALSAKQCRLCHIEVLRPEWEAEIEEQGFFIIEMEGCN